MVALPYESLIGISYGVLVGMVPALVVVVIAVATGLLSNRPLPLITGVVAAPITVGIGFSIGIFDAGAGVTHAHRIVVAAVVGAILGVVATNQGNRIAEELPRDRTGPIVRGQSLSVDAVDSVDAMGQVTIRPTGAIREFEGYPPLSPTLRSKLEAAAWRFPADLQLSELERRLECRLKSEYELSMVDVSVDGRGRATIAAAPPKKGVATALADGKRAVTITGLLPSGIEAGDTVIISSDGQTTDGEVLAVGEHQSSTGSESTIVGSAYQDATRGTDAGRGKLTVAIDTAEAAGVLQSTTYRISVLPSSGNHEFEAATLLEKAGHPVTAVDPNGESVDSATTLAVHDGTDWQLSHDDSRPDSIERAFVAGTPSEVSD